MEAGFSKINKNTGYEIEVVQAIVGLSANVIILYIYAMLYYSIAY